LKQEIKKEASASAVTAASSTTSVDSGKHVETDLWVEKHKPKSISKIIGQMGDKSNAGKLLHWLKSWKKNHGSGEKAAPKKAWGNFGASASDDGSSFKAALLSGPPGIGKTTTAQLACKEAGFTFIELNASDSRSKKLLDSILGKLCLI
jgi:replication factor C subunit 1